MKDPVIYEIIDDYNEPDEEEGSSEVGND